MNASPPAAAALQLYPLLIGLGLKAAEEAIEDARKIVWVTQFSGERRDAVAVLYARSAVADAVAGALEGRSLLEVEDILQELRFGLYVNAYGALEGSRFGAMMQAAIEADEHAAGGGKPS